MGADSRPHNDTDGAGIVMALPMARAGVLRIEPQASQAEPLIANAEWWTADPEFHEFLDEMERQDNEHSNPDC